MKVSLAKTIAFALLVSAFATGNAHALDNGLDDGRDIRLITVPGGSNTFFKIDLNQGATELFDWTIPSAESNVVKQRVQPEDDVSAIDNLFKLTF